MLFAATYFHSLASQITSRLSGPQMWPSCLWIYSSSNFAVTAKERVTCM